MCNAITYVPYMRYCLRRWKFGCVSRLLIGQLELHFSSSPSVQWKVYILIYQLLYTLLKVVLSTNTGFRLFIELGAVVTHEYAIWKLIAF